MSPITRTGWLIVIMAGSMLGEILRAKANSNLIEGLVAEYLRDEGKLDIEGRTIVYKASIRAFSFPVAYDATAQDTATGISSSAENFDDPQDAYHKAVANLLAILRQRGLMKDPTSEKEPDSDKATTESNLQLTEPEPTIPSVPEPEPRPNPPSVPGQEPEPTIPSVPEQEPRPNPPSVPGQEPRPTLPSVPEHEDLPKSHSEIDENGESSGFESGPNHETNSKQTSNVESNADLEREQKLQLSEPNEGSLGEDITHDNEAKPVLDSELADEPAERDQRTDKPSIEQLKESGWFGWALWIVVICTAAAILKCFQCLRYKIVFICVSGILVVGSIRYGEGQGWNIFMAGIVAISTFLFIKTAPGYFQVIYQRVVVVVLNLVKSLPNIVTAVQPGLLLEVTPDYLGSYDGYTMKQANPTPDMLSRIHTYKLWSQCKGLAYILNNATFDLGKRIGSEIDVQNMDHLFKELGYKTILHDDLSGHEIMSSVQSFASMFNEEGARYDSAVVVLMSHGDTGVIRGTDLAQVKLRDLQRELEGDKCPGLIGKPKLFFIQACRGYSTTRISVVADGPSSPRDEDADPNRFGHAGALPVQPDNQFASNLRDVADVYFAFATIEGHLSLRSEVIGSFFVQALCEVFFANAHVDNLDTLMNKVTDRVNGRTGKLYDIELQQWVIVNQTPERVNRMRKALYFLPKYSKNT